MSEPTGLYIDHSDETFILCADNHCSVYQTLVSISGLNSDRGDRGLYEFERYKDDCNLIVPKEYA